MGTKVVYTEAQVRACHEALSAWNGGACNGCGVSHSLTKAYEAFLHDKGTDAANTAPPVIVFLDVLGGLAGLATTTNYEKVVEAARTCERICRESGLYRRPISFGCAPDVTIKAVRVVAKYARSLGKGREFADTIISLRNKAVGLFGKPEPLVLGGDMGSTVSIGWSTPDWIGGCILVDADGVSSHS